MGRDSEPRETWGRTGAPLAWGVVGTAVCAAMIPLEPSLLEEGLILHFAQRMVRGEHLYRDLVFFSGPLPFELLAALFRVFGEEVAVGRAALALLSGVATAATFAIARRARCGAMAHAAAACFACAPVPLFPLFSTYFYTTLAVHLCALAAYAALRGVREPGWAAAAGVAVACAALTKQNVAAVVAAGLLATIALAAPRGRRLSQSGWMVGGGAATAAVTLLWFGARGDLHALVNSMVLMPLSLGAAFSSGYVNLWPPGELTGDVLRSQVHYVPHLYNILAGQGGEIGRPVVALTQLLFALPWLALLAPVARRLLAGPLPPAVWVHEMVLLALLVNLFPRSDWGHLVFVLPATLVQLLVTAFAEPAEGARRAAPGAARVAAGLLVAVIAAASFAAGRELHRRAGPASFGPRVPQLPVSDMARRPDVPRVIHAIRRHTQPGEAIFVARAEPLIYFATDTRNPTPFGGVLPGLREEQDQSITAALERVRYVVMSEIDQPVFLYYRDELPGVQAALERHFRVVEPYRRRPSWIVVLERASDRGATAIDLLERSATARRWQRDGAGVEREAAAAPPKLPSRMNRRPLVILLGEEGGGIDFEIEVPDGAKFRADVGLPRLHDADRLWQPVGDAHMQVLVRERGDAVFRTLASRRVRIKPDAAMAWTPFEVDLAGWAGRAITLRLQAVPAAPPAPGAVAWWGSPSIALPPAGE